MKTPNKGNRKRPRHASVGSEPRQSNQHKAPDDETARRNSRLHDLRLEGLANTSALESNLQSVNCDLLEFAHSLKQRLAPSLAAKPETIDELEQERRGLDQFFKVTKQIERFSQLGIRLEEFREKAKSAQRQELEVKTKPSEEIAN